MVIDTQYGENEVFESAPSGPDLVIITGMSGAGRTEAMHTLEDMGYFCIDNLPPTLLMNLVALAGIQAGSLRRLAIVCDLRSKEFFPELQGELKRLQDTNVSYRLIFLDASDDVLIRRFKANRRRHPLHVEGKGIISGIRREREMLSELKETANIVIDTTGLQTTELRKQIRQMVLGAEGMESGLKIDVYSFGFKHGQPIDADIMIDVRFLPNPFYVPSLRTKTGLDDAVREFVLNAPETSRFLDAWLSLLDTILPGYVNEGKQHLSIALGCTGGQHRSVVLAQETGRHLTEAGYSSTVSHRDIALAETN